DGKDHAFLELYRSLREDNGEAAETAYDNAQKIFRATADGPDGVSRQGLLKAAYEEQTGVLARDKPMDAALIRRIWDEDAASLPLPVRRKMQGAAENAVAGGLLNGLSWDQAVDVARERLSSQYVRDPMFEHGWVDREDQVRPIPTIDGGGAVTTEWVEPYIDSV